MTFHWRTGVVVVVVFLTACVDKCLSSANLAPFRTFFSFADLVSQYISVKPYA